MGWVVMGGRELARVEALSRVSDGSMSLASAAVVMGVSRRQARRLLRRFRTEGAAAVRHRARGRPSNNRIRDGVCDYALTLVRENYADFGPTLAAEKLAERHGLEVLRETLRGWMAADGLWLPRAQRRRLHRPRLRRERFGELVQIDGSEHRWFEGRGPPCTLLVFIDDATSTLMQCGSSPPRARSRTSRRWRAISRTARGLLLRQELRLPGGQARSQERARHDPVRPGAGRAAGRDRGARTRAKPRAAWWVCPDQVDGSGTWGLGADWAVLAWSSSNWMGDRYPRAECRRRGLQKPST